MKHNLMMKYSFISTLLVAVALCLLVLPCDRVNAGPPDSTPSLAMDIRTRLQPYQTPDAEPSRYDGRLLKEAPLPPEVEEPPIGPLAQQTFYAVADATVLQGYPTLNFWGTMDMWAGPEPGHYTGTPSVSFDVTADQQVCNFDITVPFSDDTCRIRPDDCAEIVNNEFTFVKDHPVFVDPYYRITGTFDTQTHALGDYAVWECNYQRFVTPFEGTWEASGNNPPNLPSNPSPTDGATDQGINVDLSWTGGDPDAGDTVTYDVYFEANDPPGNLICDDVSTPACDPGTLAYDTHYYWYVVATDNHGASTTGTTWDFYTGSEPNNPPNPPSNPSPTDGATDQGINVDLGWTGGDPDAGDTVTYDVYFEANDPPGNLICDDVSTPVCDPGMLDYSTHYYWYVVATDNYDASTTGDTWDFTTGPAPAPPAIDSVTPNSGNNNEVVHTTIAGTGFQSGATVRLIKTGPADIVATNVVVVPTTTITCDFDLRGAYPGKWTVRVTNPGTPQYAEKDFTVNGLVFLPIVLRNP